MWGIPGSEITADWAAQRIKGLSLAVALKDVFRWCKKRVDAKTLINEFDYLRLQWRGVSSRGANYHVFAFIDGRRPSDELITATLDEADAPVKEANHAEKTPVKVKVKSRRIKKRR